MRITRETLLKLARETVTERAGRDRGILCAYLTGSLLGDDPLLGGTTDIDLVFVHDRDPLTEREIVRLSEDVHVDIAHFPQSLFDRPRHLRVSTWIGPYLCANPLVLHDQHHWFEYTQASVCAQFYQPDYVYQRVRTFSSAARQGWLGLQGSQPGPAQTLAYLNVLEDAANAIASFSGPPLSERRLFLLIGARAEAIGRPGLSGGLMDLISTEQPTDENWQAWQAAWSGDLEAAAVILGERVPRLNRQRKRYYTRAADALWQPSPAAALWIALRTWSLALREVAEASPDAQNTAQELPGRSAWQSMLETLGLAGTHFDERLDMLDAFLDTVEEAQDAWAQEYGIESNI